MRTGRGTLVDPDALLPDAPRVRDALDAAGWSTDALDALLGVAAREHLDRDELAPLLRRTRDAGPLGVLARLLVVGVPVPEREARSAGVPASWLGPDGSALVRLQQVRHDGVEVLCPHDPGRTATGLQPEQVLGVGAASLTLAAATPRDLVGSALDLGTGCGVQALLADDSAGRVVATDRNPRASAYARLAAALNRTELDVRTGDLLEPVVGERFDLVVSNPPFVIGPQHRYTYRDSGLAGDQICRRLVQGVPAHLADGGVAVLLANWLHRAGEDGDERVTGWFAGTGCDGWVVQRELAAPEEYVTAWLRDSDEGDRFDELYDPWLDALAEQRVEAVAFGVLALRRGGRERVALEHVDQPVAAIWGRQVREHFAALDLLETDLRDARLRLRDDVRLHQVARRTDEGWLAGKQVLRQEAGLRWRGGVDVYGATLLAGCDGRQRLGDLLAVLAASAGLSEGEAAEQVLPVVRRLVEQGFLTG